MGANASKSTTFKTAALPKDVSQNNKRKASGKNPLCSGCRRARQQPDWQDRLLSAMAWLYCSRCKMEHRAWLFSADQRRRPCRKRICIGHEGRLRICAHKAVSWAMLRSIAEADGWDGVTAADMGLPQLVAGCGRECVAAAGLSAAARAGAGADPRLTMAVTPAGGWLLRVGWSVYVGGEDGGRTLPAADQLVERLAELRAAVGMYIFRGNSAVDFPEIGTLDPAGCQCLLVHEDSCKTTGVGMGSARRAGTCLTREGNSPPNDHEEALLCRRDTVRMAHAVYGRRQWTPKNTAEYVFTLSRYETDNTYTASWARYIHLPAQPVASMTGCPLSWCLALDPDSYRLTKDTEGLNVYWCREEGCMNHYQYRGPPEVDSSQSRPSPCA